MLTLENTINHVRQVLDDAAASRFSDDLLESAVRQALARIDESMPLVSNAELEVVTGGRDQALADMENCLYLIDLHTENAPDGELEYVYTLQGGTIQLHFSGVYTPQAGEILTLTVAGRNTLSGLDGALTTSLPESAAAALEFGAAGFACLLRAAVVAEAYGARPGESARLVEQSRLWLEQCANALQALKNLQEFGFPPGFKLDAWDRRGG